MQKIMQKVTSVALAASMLFSMMSTTALAFADETGDSTSVSTDVTDAPAAEEADAVDSGSSNDADSSDATSAPTITDVADLTHESYEDANSNDETTQDATSDVVDGEETSESDASDTEVSTPETAEPTFVGLQTVTPEYGDKLTADVGDSVTLDALLNRDDVAVTYQWQRKQNFAVDTALALYNYEEDEPTWYDFVWEDSTEAATLESTPDFTWQGCEMYFAIVDALDDIGADSSDVQVAWHTPNFVLDGYSISAGTAEDGTTEIYASNEENTYTARVNDEGKWEFSDESTANLKNDWQDIEDATESTYTFEVTEDNLFATYRCRITVTDEAYREENFKALEDLGNELTDEDKAGDIILQTVQFSVSLPEDENSSDVATQNMPDTVVMLADTFSSHSADSIAISSDNQWITGLNGNYEYITKNMYDQVTEWFKAGKIDKATADRYWTRIGGSWASNYTANELDDNSYPTGATRTYSGFPLTDGNMLEVNSEWYGQTVYFRPHNDSNDWNLTGTAVNVPAYTAVLRNNGSYGTGASGTKYKDAVVFLNPWVSDAGRMYAKFLSHPDVSDNGWLKNTSGQKTNQHITVLSIQAETFNADPNRFMMDAEGNYRIDSIGWGVCVNQEPDLSGKAYYAIKAFLSQGYGMCIGHDTMYAYAGSWYDAHEAGYTDPGSRDYYEGGRYGPDKNDTSTRYYVLNSVPNIDNGHWNMNALMGANGGNIDSGTVLPTDAISMILSTGGSHSSYGKAGIMYGSDQLSIKLKPYSSSQAQSTVKYRVPTNFPYDLSGTLSASKTHSNSQVAFGPIWVDYAGGNVTGAEFGYNPDPTTKTITDEETGQSWFGTSNFYLSGTGNFLMNQIGHLPENSATVSEARLFSNTVMYISQRKQCEICAAQQNGQEDVHFVIRVSSVNAQQVLAALQNGGTFWYPLNGCYQLTDDLTLPEGWKPIKNFSGHWNADVYKVKLASNNQPVFDNTSVTANGMYTSGKNNGWNLGSDMTKGTLPILKLDNQPDVRITGVARVVGDLNALFPTSYGVTDYTGYKVVVHGSDGVDYNCVVNSDSKYVISNLPTTGMMRADVIDKSGNKVTQFGMITVDVPNHFWNDTETHPLQLMTPTADPIDDYKDWEGPVNKTVDSKLYYNEQLKASDVTWYYRIISVDNQVGDWVKIGNPGTSFDTSDGTVSGKINSLTFTEATDSDLPYTTSSVSYSKLDYTTNRIQFKCEYTLSGTVYSSMDKAEDGRNGYVDVEIRPMYIEQAFDRRISVGGSTSFSFDAFYWKGVEDGLTYEVQYRDVSGNWVAVGSDSTLFPSSKYKISYVTKTDDNDALGGGVWYPSDFWVPDSFTGSDAKMNAGKSTFNKHTTVTLELSNAAMDWDGTDFRCVFTYKSTGHTMSTDTTTANDIAQARTGHLIIYAPPIEMTPLKAQSLLLNNYDSSNGNLAWTTPASNPNNGRSPKEIPLDAINPDKLGQGGKAYGAAGDNKAIYTTKITYYGNKDSAPTIKWLYSDVAGGGSLSQFKDVGDAVTLKYSDVGKKIGNISKLNSRVAELEKSFMSSGKAFNKFSGYIKLEAMYPTESKDLNNSSYAEWNAIVSLYIYYICYDAPTTKANMDQVYFYIDEQNSGASSSQVYSEPNSTSKPYSMYTAPYTGEYIITLNGAGGGVDNQFGLSPERTSLGGKTTIRVKAEKGATLYFVNGGAGSHDPTHYVNGASSPDANAKVVVQGGYNGGGNGGIMMKERYTHWSLKGASGGGATTVAVGIIGTGRLAEYGDENNAKKYVLGVAGGGGANQHGACDATGGSDNNGVLHVWGGQLGGGGPFGQGMSGGDFSMFLGGITDGSSEVGVEGPGGGGGGWYGGYANESSKLANADGWGSCKRDGNGGLSWAAGVGTTLTDAGGHKVQVLEVNISNDGGGSGSEQAGSSSIELVKSSVSRFSRNGKNAFDTAYEDTDPDSGIEEQHVTITITAANKLYDGNPDEATVSVSGNLSSTDMDNIVKNTTIVYANRKGTLTKAPSDASTDKNQYPRSDCGSYTATAKCTVSGYIITYRYENTNPGHTYDGSSPSGIGDTVKFDIYPRGLTIIGTGDKPYDRTSKATLENVHIASGGLIAKDENTVKLSTTTVTGNYTVDGKNVSDAGGPYVVIRTSELSLVGNSAGNYYIEKEDLSGSITPLDLYVHSIYLEDPTYPRNVKHYDGTTKATIKDILIDGVLEGDDVKIKEETLPGNYKTKDAGQKLNADGTVSSNWPYELDENPITADAHPTLTGKDAKNYRITKEKYSGAIARANLTAQVASWRGLYGDGVGEKPWHDKKAYGYGTAASAGCWLELDGLVQGDTLTLDQSYKKSYFKTLVNGHEDLVPDESTPVGTYPLTYVGLTEANYPVLKNYIVMVLNGRFVVDPRPLHVTVLDSDKIIYNENPNFHVNIQMEDDDANLIDVVSDVDATPILDAKLKAKDTVSSVLYVAGGNPSNLTQEFVDAYDYRKQENVKESKTNIPFVTDCTIASLPLYADGTSTDDDFEWNYEDKTCDFCHYNHKLLAPYLVTINTDTKSGPALDVHTVVNPNGETVRNYELIIHDGGLYVHPALLKATVPLYVCMYGNTTSGEVKEPTNYRITNYSTVAIQIKNIKANGPWLMRDMPGMEYYPDGEYGNSVYDMTKNRLRRGELYMRLRDTVLTQGDNAIDHSDTAWVIPKATGDFINNNITGRAMQVPMAVYIATGNVNESGVCTPVTKVTYTIAPYGGVMPNDADFEKVQSQPWLKDAK